MVLAFNISMVITFATVQCAIQLVIQRMAQVLTVVMISHMFLNLKDCNLLGQEEPESSDGVFTSIIDREKALQSSISFDMQVARPKTMLSLVGTLGNDLMHTSILNY
jgi:hypothetical protein